METSQLKNEIETIFLRENEEKIFSYWEFLTCITGELTCPPWQMVKRLPRVKDILFALSSPNSKIKMNELDF